MTALRSVPVVFSLMAATFALSLAGCRTDAEGPSSLATPELAQKTANGSWVEIELDQNGDIFRTEGELIAIEKDRIVVLSGHGLASIPFLALRHFRIVRYKTNPGGPTAWSALGGISTLSHGAWLIFTMPMWMIAGGVASSNQATAARDNVTLRSDLPKYAKYARFPQGLPNLAGTRLGRVRRLGLWPRTTRQSPRRAMPALLARLQRAAVCGAADALPVWCELANNWNGAGLGELRAGDVLIGLSAPTALSGFAAGALTQDMRVWIAEVRSDAAGTRLLLRQSPRAIDPLAIATVADWIIGNVDAAPEVAGLAAGATMAPRTPWVVTPAPTGLVVRGALEGELRLRGEHWYGALHSRTGAGMLVVFAAAPGSAAAPAPAPAPPPAPPATP